MTAHNARSDIKVYESRRLGKWQTMLIADPTAHPWVSPPLLCVGDLLLWRTRVAVHEAIKVMFDAERARLGLS